MKRPQPDINKVTVDKYIASVGSNRKLKRLWGTTTVNGYEVLNLRRHYHKPKDRPDNYEELFKFLKVFKSVEDYKGEGIRSAWFTLNKSNGPESLRVSGEYVAENLNRMWWDPSDGPIPENLSLTTTIVISEKYGKTESLRGIDWDSDKDTLASYISDNYEQMWSDGKIAQEGVGVINRGVSVDPVTKTEVPDEDDLSPDDPWLSVVSRYALRNSGIPCTVKNVEVGIGIEGIKAYTTAVVTLEIPYYSFSESSPLVRRVVEDSDFDNFPKPRSYKFISVSEGFSSNNEHLTQASVKAVTYYDELDEVDASTVSREYLQWEDYSTEGGKYDNYWTEYKGKYYFKSAVIDKPEDYGITHVELNEYLLGLLDTGYKKEKVSIWKKIVAIVVFIIAVVLAFFSYGATSDWVAYAYAAAYAVLVGAAVVALVTLFLSAIGAGEWASAFAWVSKEIDPLVTVASIVLIVASFQNGITEGIKQIAADQAADYVFEVILGEFGEMGRLIADTLSGNVSSSTIENINKLISAYSTIQLAKLENITERTKDLKAEYDALAEEASAETDTMRGFMNIYGSPATADWSIYASTYDLPYERGGGILSTGNIQRTTKQAIRKSDYDEPMFDGLIFV